MTPKGLAITALATLAKADEAKLLAILLSGTTFSIALNK